MAVKHHTTAIQSGDSSNGQHDNGASLAGEEPAGLHAGGPSENSSDEQQGVSSALSSPFAVATASARGPQARGGGNSKGPAAPPTERVGDLCAGHT